MNYPLIVLSLAVAASLLIYRHIISPIFSPLSRIPSPNPLCYITDYLIHYLAWREQEFDWLLKHHRRFGPLLRIGPTTVSVNSVQGLRQVYTSLEKPKFYAQFANYRGTPNMFSTLDHQRHSVQKRILSGVFAKSFLQRSQHIRKISEHVFTEQLAPLLRHLADTHRPVNVFQVFQFLGLDIFTAYAFGLDKSTQFIQNHGHEGRSYHSSDPRSIYESKDKRDQNWLSEDECLSLCKEIAKCIDKKQAAAPTTPVVFEKLYSTLSAQKPPLARDTLVLICASEMRDQLIASQEATGIALTYATYHLSKSPDLQSRLREEVTTSDMNDLDALPLLNAIIQETLRLHAPSAGRQPRLSPPQGMTLHGYYLPAATSISSSSYVLHRTESVYPDPEAFIPDRWMDASEEMKRWWWGFGSGGRMCIGNHFATMIMQKALIEVYGQFETKIVDERGTEQMKAFIAAPRGRRLILGLERVKSL